MRSAGRYVAIAMIIALGAGMFVGLRSTKMDMIATGQSYMDEQNMFDLRLLSTYGWDREQLDAISGLDGLVQAEGVFYSDLIVGGNGEDEAVYRFYTLPHEINKLVLLNGRMPAAPDECLADGFRNGKNVLGKTVSIADNNADASLNQLTVRSFTIVGTVSTPLYMDINRGNTSIGSGSIANYFFVPEDAFDVSYYTEIHARISGSHEIYSEEYSDAMEAAAQKLKPLLVPLAEARMASARTKAEQAYADGVEEYENGCKDFAEEKKRVLQELADAQKKLLDGEEEIKASEQELLDSEKAAADGWVTLEENRKKLEEAEQKLDSASAGGQAQLSSASASLMAKQAELESNAQMLEAGLAEINAKLVEVKSGIVQIKTGQAQISAAIRPLEALVKIADINAETSEKTIETLEKLGAPESHLNEARRLLQEVKDKRAEYTAQIEELSQKKAELDTLLAEATAGQAQLEAKKAELIQTREEIRSGRTAINEGYEEIYRQRSSADGQIISARQQIIDGKKQIWDNEKLLKQADQEIADGWEKLNAGKEELAQGWADYHAASEEAEAAFRDAEAELQEAAQKLEDAKKTIADIVRTDVYVLDRNSNIGYSSLDSSSDIVAGVARVFPVFFILVAALVCITTMTRMVDEERTQIGTLKALGYSNAAIISKYLLYAGSSALLGCTIGIALGSIIFPVVLWEAYKIILFLMPTISVRFDWQMAAEVFLMYTTAMLLVTWYCCHHALREVPAELIRPKAPTSGKELLIEKFRLWRRVSFLNKVAIRNIFRYRQRLAMMLLGIGGCTALLMTGFGIRDSISKIVDVQFRDVTSYDLAVYFRAGRTEEEQNAFREDMAIYADEIMFFYQVSGEIEANNQTRDIYLVSSGEEITDFIDFHYSDASVPLPEKGEALISSGISEMLNLKIGDRLTIRNPDMEALTLTVSGIYENHVYNYAFVSPETIAEQWGREPDMQMAYVNVRSGRSASYAGAAANGLDGVVNVTVSEQLAENVNTMMAAMDLVVIVVVFCAGILAVIVLYNLTNININERIREIATIKVLGFNASETAMYVFKENLVLSVFGTVFGIPLGKLLLDFVISQIKIDLIWIKPQLTTASLLLSVVLTVFSAVVVDGIFYFKLEKINMAEALKSVE